ncbi:hypothetical protein MNBD_GAMMA11-3491 [hydrothermal vent metagenome]|uniref:eCIS core domain-containing protein n=1 Tax=hydrothermal vent metagenome TaxID=652676 RepID=A0A3B0XTG9_9ZZZZ
MIQHINTPRKKPRQRPVIKKTGGLLRIPSQTAPLIAQRKTGCSCGGNCPACQPDKFIPSGVTIGPSNDKYEQEADHVADSIMQAPENRIQRKPSGEGTSKKQSNTSLMQSSGKALNKQERSFFESRMNTDLGHVRLHSGADADKAATSVGARAFTLGNNIVIANGEYNFHSLRGKKLMAHELTHVIQQTVSADKESYLTSDTHNAIQRQEHEEEPEGAEGEFSLTRGFSLLPGGVTNRFGFEATLEVPLLDFQLGPLAFLNQLEITTEGSTESPSPIPLSATQIQALKTEIALRLISLKMDEIRRNTRFGNFNLQAGTGVNATASGELNTEGADAGVGANVSTNAEAGFQSLPFPFLGTRGVRIALGLEGEATAGISTGASPSIEFEGNASVGLSAPRLPGAPVVKLSLGGSAEMSRSGGRFVAEARGFSVIGSVVGRF